MKLSSDARAPLAEKLLVLGSGSEHASAQTSPRLIVRLEDFESKAPRTAATDTWGTAIFNNLSSRTSYGATVDHAALSRRI